MEEVTLVTRSRCQSSHAGLAIIGRHIKFGRYMRGKVFGTVADPQKKYKAYSASHFEYHSHTPQAGTLN